MAMRIKLDGLKFCPDCACLAANGDASGVPEAALALVTEGVTSFGPHLVAADQGPQYSDFECASCKRECSGDSHYFAVLEPDPWSGVRTKAQIKAIISLAYQALREACEKDRTLGIDTQRALRDLWAVCDKQEKDHMSFGRRLLGRRPTRAADHETRVQYFVVQAALDPCRVKSALDAYRLREDKVIGAALAQTIGKKWLAGKYAHVKACFLDIDYAADLAGE